MKLNLKIIFCICLVLTFQRALALESHDMAGLQKAIDGNLSKIYVVDLDVKNKPTVTLLSRIDGLQPAQCFENPSLGVAQCILQVKDKCGELTNILEIAASDNQIQDLSKDDFAASSINMALYLGHEEPLNGCFSAGDFVPPKH